MLILKALKHMYKMAAKLFIAAALLTYAALSYAHSEVGVAGGLVSGFLHPILGFDHLLAMVAVGLWGAQLGKPSIWMLPVTFPLVMACGGLIGIAGIAIPFVELGISVSALALGAAVLLCWRPPLIVATIMVAIFAIYHGHAHGTELPSAVNPLAYGAGFVISTGLMHLCGICIGLISRWPKGKKALRGLGGVIASIGVLFVANTLGWLA